ncbi:hypothetical protein CTI12_AA467260 [Artemisia annua]|uniref:Uncharacterized protein n=1 Tax=Artemisia annua TaxID=35608 RepID=A0A2U1LPH5_ARTAN|nr:hypothetical protein CTI12_AA467260 [Artemisia annua]
MPDTIHDDVHVDEDYTPDLSKVEFDYACFLQRFVLTFMYLNSGRKVAGKIHKMRHCIMNGHPKDYDFSVFMWLLVENELKILILKSYYICLSHAMFDKVQHNNLFVNPVDDDVGRTGDDAGRTRDDVVGNEKRKQPSAPC